MEEYVFLIYSHVDRQIAKQIASELAESNIQVWLDTYMISPGADWAASTDSAFNKASAFLVIISSNLLQSEFAISEIHTAMQSGKKVIPVVIDDEAVHKMPGVLRRLEYIDFRRNHEQALSELISNFRGFIKEEGAREIRKPLSKGYVFLSYATEDLNFTEEVKDFCARQGYAYWDYRESDRDYHGQLSFELEAVIKEAAVLLCILSPNWRLSDWAVREYNYAIEIKKPVFLLRFGEMGATLLTTGIPYIDFIRDKEEGFSKLARELGKRNL